MDLYYKQELRVGALVMVAAVGLMVGGMWLKGQGLFGWDAVEVQVRFANVNGLKVGNDVKVLGVKVGRVKNVELRGWGDVVVALEVSRRHRPREGANVSVASLNFLGDKYLEYFPGNGRELGVDSVITGTPEESILDRASQLTGRASDALSGVTNLLSDTTAQQIRRTLEAVERTLNVVARLGEGPTVGELQETLRAVQQLAVRMDSTIIKPDIGKSLDQMDEIATSIREMSEGLSTATTSLGSILQRIDRGEGTLGKAVNDSTLHQDLHETLVSLRKLLDDVRERPGRYVNVKVF